MARGIYRSTPGAFMSVLMQEWTYRSVKGLIYDWSEVPVCLPFTEGAVISRWLMSLGGSESQSQQMMVHRSIYGDKQGDSKQKSTIGAWLMI